MNKKGFFALLTAAMAGVWHTVVSQLQAMFLYRVAAGSDNDDLPESNGRAVIDAIYGNTIKWNQMIPIPDTDASINSSGVTITDNRDGSYTISTVETGATANKGITLINGADAKFVVGHKYFITGIRGGKSTTYALRNNYSGNAGIINCYNPMVFTALKTVIGITVHVMNGAVITTPVTVKPQIIDLTALEYPDIETTTPTVAQVEAWLALNVGEQDYYPYDEGSLISFKGQGVRTIKNNVELDRKPFNVTKVYGKLGGEGSLVQVFTNKDSGDQSISYYGMNFVGNDYYTREDKIYIDSNTGKLTAIQAVKRADLGKATWALYTGQNHTFRTDTYGVSGTERIPVNVVGYTEVTTTITDSSNDLSIGFSPGGSKGLRFVNQSLSSSDIVDGKIAALEGVEIVYGLVTPNIYTELIYRDNGTDTPLEEVFPIKYKVDKYSTEELLVPASVAGEPTSTALVADIEYQKM